jgi:hypothetical protein
MHLAAFTLRAYIPQGAHNARCEHGRTSLLESNPRKESQIPRISLFWLTAPAISPFDERIIVKPAEDNRMNSGPNQAQFTQWRVPGYG